MIKYNVHEHEDGSFVISGQEDNGYWLVQAVFEPHEKEYAEVFCNILNEETKRAYDSAEWKMSKAYFDSTGKFFNYHIG